MTDDENLGESTAAGRALNAGLRRAMRPPWLSDLAFKIIFLTVSMGVGTAIAAYSVRSLEATQLVVVALVMQHFSSAAATVWSRRPC